MLALAPVISTTLGIVFSSQCKQRYFAMRHYKVEVIKTFIAVEKKSMVVKKERTKSVVGTGRGIVFHLLKQ